MSKFKKFIIDKSNVYSSICLSILVGLLYEQICAAALIASMIWIVFVCIRLNNIKESLLGCISDVFINIIAVSIIEIIKSNLPTIYIVIGMIILLIIYALLYLFIKHLSIFKKYMIK